MSAPTDDELRAFVESMLSNLDKQLREPEVIEETIRDHRDMWTRLYQAGLGFDTREDDST
ncbi:MAG: hypothetical protein ACXW0R_13705 [Gaiellaceae bacterium]